MSLTEHKHPRIVLVGPTNVGKSALFNRLTRTRRAIVCDRPGVTVDRHELKIEDVHLGPLTVIDTGGVGPLALEHPFGTEIIRAAAIAVKEADLILFVVDGTHEAGVDELEVASWLRHQEGTDQKSIWVLANKCDSKKHDASSYYQLGFDRVDTISAEHDIGILDLWEEMGRFFKSRGLLSQENASKVEGEVEVPKAKTSRVIVLGRPNVGKSTLLNQIIGQERHVVSEVSGTTRDPIETEHKVHGQIWTLIDTAGIRQPGRLDRDVEWVAREKLKEYAKESNVAILVVDASQGITVLDATIAGMALDFGLSLVIASNKWDKMHGDDADELFAKLERTTDLKMEFIKWCPWVKISALTGKGLPELLKTVEKVIQGRQQRVQTSKLNHLFDKRIRLHHHPLGTGGKPAKFYYMSQVSVNPPEFVLFSNLPGTGIHFSFRRFLVNSLREEFGFFGSPIRLHFKKAHKKTASDMHERI